MPLPESKLTRATSVGVGLALAALVYAIYDQTVPATVDIRVQEAGDRDLGASEKTARWLSGGMVALVSLITMDATVFVLGGSMVVGMSWSKRHANYCQPGGASVMPSSRQILDGSTGVGYSPTMAS
jgi:hypothetical protein